MANIDVDFVGGHGKTDAQPDEATGETIPLTPAGVIEGESTWEPEQEASFRGTSMGMEVLKEHVKALYHALTQYVDQSLDAFHFNDFERNILHRQGQVPNNAFDI